MRGRSKDFGRDFEGLCAGLCAGLWRRAVVRVREGVRGIVGGISKHRGKDFEGWIVGGRLGGSLDCDKFYTFTRSPLRSPSPFSDETSVFFRSMMYVCLCGQAHSSSRT